MKTDEIVVNSKKIAVFVAIIFGIICILAVFNFIDKRKSVKQFNKQQEEIEVFFSSDTVQNFFELLKNKPFENAQEINLFLKRLEDENPSWLHYKIVVLHNNKYCYLEKYDRYNSIKQLFFAEKLSASEAEFVKYLNKNEEERVAFLFKKSINQKKYIHLAGKPEAFIMITIAKN